MERNIQKNGLVNLVAAVAIFVAAFVVAAYAGSLGGQTGSVFLGLGMLVAFTSWFQMRLEENERLEKLEMEELARASGESALFEAKASEVFPARRSREQFEKYFVPGFAVLLFLLEAGGAWLLWSWSGKTVAVIRTPNATMPRFRSSRFSRCCCFCSAAFRSPSRGSKTSGCCVRARIFCWRARMSAGSPRWASPASKPNFPGPISGSRARGACCSA